MRLPIGILALASIGAVEPATSNQSLTVKDLGTRIAQKAMECDSASPTWVGWGGKGYAAVVYTLENQDSKRPLRAKYFDGSFDLGPNRHIDPTDAISVQYNSIFHYCDVDKCDSEIKGEEEN